MTEVIFKEELATLLNKYKAGIVVDEDHKGQYCILYINNSSEEIFRGGIVASDLLD